MFISDRVYKNLDLDYVFSRLVVYTPYGESYKKSMRPYLPCQRNTLIEEYQRIEKIVGLLEKERYTFTEIRNLFKHIKDLRGTFKRVEEKLALSVVELFEIKTLMSLFERLQGQLKKLKWELPEELRILSIDSLKELLDPQKSGVNTFYIYEEYSEILREIRKELKEIEVTIQNARGQVRKRVQSQLGIKIRPNGEFVVNKSDKELIARVEQCQELIYSAETYMNITYRIKTEEGIDQQIKKIQELKEQEEAEELRIRERLTLEIAQYLKEIYHNLHAVGTLDLLIGKAYLALGMEGVKPSLIEEEKLEILEGRHIKVADTLKKQGKNYTPISVSLKKGVACITGANMGGKTVSLKLIGLLTAMAQYGLFVPAKEMQFSLKEYIFFSLGDQQSVDMGLSTFGAEILEIKEILKRFEERGLVLIDELARGTNPSEGYAISKAFIQFLKDKEPITVITTHFDRLAEDKDIQHLQVRGLRDVDYKELKAQIKEGNTLGIELVHQYMDYRLEVIKEKTKIPRDAINIARLMGLQEEILEAAERELEVRS